MRRALTAVASFAPDPAPLGPVMRACNPRGEVTINALVKRGLLVRGVGHPSTVRLS